MLVHHGRAASRRILGAFLRAKNGRKSSCNDALHHFGIAAERRWTFTGVENAEPARRSRADVEQPPVPPERSLDETDQLRDLLALAGDRVSDRTVFGVLKVGELDGGREIDVGGA